MKTINFNLNSLEIAIQNYSTNIARPLITDDTILFGVFALILGVLFYSATLPRMKKLFTFVPVLLLCYLIPAILRTTGIISEEYSTLYTMAKNYLLPAALVLMTLGIDLKGLKKLGSKAIIMFLTGTVGVMIGGPLAILIVSLFSPETVGGEGYNAAWRGFSTLAGSWIGGGANQAAMLETFKYNDDFYGRMVTVDIVVANLWMAILLYGAGIHKKIDKWLKADNSAVEGLKKRMQDYQSSTNRIPSTSDFMVILAIAFGTVALSHFFGEYISTFLASVLGEESPFAGKFLWLVVLATTIGLLFSFTKLRSYEGAGASKIGSVFIYILVVTIGMKMDLLEAFKQPMLLLVGLIWMFIHVLIMLVVAKIIRAPFFFVAVGSKANIGGAASAPVVASAFDPSLASVGAILAVLGYAVGTYGAIFCARMMEIAAP